MGTRHQLNVYDGGGIPGHAISFMFGHPSMQPLWTNNDPWSWIDENMRMPAKEVGESPVDDECQKKIINDMKEILPLREQEVLIKKLDELTFQGTYRELRDSLVKMVAGVRGTYNKIDCLEVKIDTLLMKHLPKDLRNKTHVLHIADSNWLNESDQQNIHFCLLYSPFTEKVELWKVNQNGSNLRKCLKEDWLHSKPWQFFREL
jgi:hypothetical protein